MAKHQEEVETPGTQEKSTGYGRRRFLSQALAASAGLAMAGWVPRLKASPLAAGCAPPNPLPTNELVNPGQITSVGAKLQSVLVVRDEQRTIPTVTGKIMLRAYEGYSGNRIDPKKRVTKPGVYGPGPTFRASVGDTIQIAFLNHIDPRQFPETANETCDTVKNATGGQVYPTAPPGPTDKFPDCFRGSNTTNMHFHGTHVSPNAFSDNVLIEIVPDLTSKPEDCDKLFDTVACKDYPNPQAWKHQDEQTNKALQGLFSANQQRLQALSPERYDPELHKRQATQNETLLKYDEFPQFWSGCFPYCIRPPKYQPPYLMGQSPGTHWYHAHKHGSTSIQVFNGMAGALILEGNQPGEYDYVLNQSMPGIQQKVLVLQEYSQQPNMEITGGANGSGGGNGSTPILLVNGQSVPVITMQAGEVQWWRLINGTVHRAKGGFICGFTPNVEFRQIAQDGVQFDWLNYYPQIKQPISKFLMGSGNRVDILVRAPNTVGSTATLAGPNNDNIVTINVVAATGQCNTKWPEAENQYPKLPSFLKDIVETSECRMLKFQMPERGAIPMINGKTFQEGIIDESMLLDTKQEWTLENYSTSAAGSPLHPFHIHVNPFQIVEIFDPAGSLGSVLSPNSAAFGDWSKVKKNPNGSFALPAPWVWWDTFPLPVGKDPNTPGYIKMRTMFADFAGKFVDHCHILAHEDRGMMQLIEVVDNKTVVKHH